MSKQNTKKFPLEIKQSSSRLTAESNQPISQTAKDLGVKKPQSMIGLISIIQKITVKKEIKHH